MLPNSDLNRFPAERPQVDAESIVNDLLVRSFDGDPDWDGTLVFNEIDVDADAYVSVTDVVVFHVEPPKVGASNHRGRVWQCSVSLLVESVDADRAFSLAAFVRRAVMSWPRMGFTDYGRVLRVIYPPSFEKAAGGKQATSKGVKQYATGTVCSLLIEDCFSD